MNFDFLNPFALSRSRYLVLGFRSLSIAQASPIYFIKNFNFIQAPRIQDN